MTKKIAPITTALVFLLAASSCADQLYASSDRTDSDLESILGSIEVHDGEHVRDVSSVIGGIELGSNSSARNVECVNGGIDIGDQVSVKSVKTVNGGIEAGENFSSENSIATVNGAVQLGAGGHVGRDVATINGDISLIKTLVEHNVKTNNGDVSLVQGTLVKGDLIIEKSAGWFSLWNGSSDVPVIEIDASSEVSGTIHLYKKVELKIAKEAKVGDIEHHYFRK